jgi:CheY-like chemotaxis protein
MKKRILVVDDEPALTRMIKMSLEQTGRFDVRTENQGLKAIAAVREFQPDLVVLDIMMPDMSGDAIAAKLKEDPQLQHTRFIFLTAIVTRDEAPQGGSEIGGNLFLAKPVKAAELIATIDSLVS